MKGKLSPKYGLIIDFSEEYSATMKVGKDETEMEIRVNILQVDEKAPKYCVEFIREAGDRFEFNEMYKTIREFYAGLINAKE